MEKILVIKNQKDSTECIADILKKYNYSVDFALNAKQAFVYLSENRYNLVVLEQFLPENEGNDLIKSIRKEKKSDLLPLLFIANTTDETIILQYLNSGANDYIINPFSEFHIRVKIENLLRLQKKSCELKEKEIVYEEAQQLGNVGHWEYDILNDKLKWSNQVYHIYGLLPEEFKPSFSNIVNKFHPDDRNLAVLLYLDCIKNKTNIKIEHRILTPLNEIKYVIEKATVIIDKNEEAIAVIGAVIDITEQKKFQQQIIKANHDLKLANNQYLEQVEELKQLTEILNNTNKALSESENRFKAIFNHADVGIATIEFTGNILLINQAWCSMLGYTENELQNLSIFDITFPDDIEYTKDCIDKLKKGTLSNCETETRFKRKDHSTIWVTIAISVINDIENGTFCLIAIIIDITDKKIKNQEIKKLSTVIEQSPTSIIITDVKGIIEYINPQFSKVTGYSINEVIGRKSNLLNSGYHSNEFFKELWNTILNKRIWKGELFNKRKDGSYFWEDTLIAPILNEKNEIINLVAVKQDITARKQSEEKLLAEKERFVTVMNSIDSGIYVADFETYELLFANKYFTDILGESVGKKCYSVIQKNQSTPCSFCTNSILLDKSRDITKPYVWEFQNTLNNLWFNIHDMVIRWIDGRLARLEIATDITELKNALLNIKQSEENYSLFFNTLKDFLWILDEKGIIVYVNDYVINRLGYTREELIGSNIFILLPPERHLEASAVMKDMLSGKVDYSSIPIITKTGIAIPVETRAIYGMWSGKKTIFGISKDISEIRLSEEKFSKAFHNNANLMAISIFETGEYIDVNQAFLNMFQLKKEHVIGKTSIDLKIFSKDTRKKILSEVLTNNRIVNLELSFNLNNEEKYGLFSAEIIWIQNKKCWITVMQDITEMKKAEQTIKEQNNELIKLNTDKDRFMQILAHDLRSPFSSLLGITELLLENLNQYSNDEVINYLSIISQSQNKIFELLQDLLLWSQSQAGKLPFNPEKLNFNQICNEIINEKQSQAAQKKILIHCPVIEPIYLNADLNMFKTILRNLIANAIKFTNLNGRVIISVKKEGNWAAIIVSDNGIGMSEEIISKLWNHSKPFTSKGTENEKGTGLGLLLCKEFVEKHCGNIWVESIPEKGSHFKFTLPLFMNVS